MSPASEVSLEVPSPVARLLEIFHVELAGVSFPGVDAAVLDGAAAAVHAAAREVEQALVTLAAARVTLAGAQDELGARAQRALAYARVYAADEPVLLGELEGLAVPRRREPGERGEVAAPVEGVAPRRRGRPPRTVPPASLFAPEADPAVDAEELAVR
jgi:hypothetical protein